MKVQRENRGVTGAYSVVQGFFWMSFAAVMGFSSVYLLGCGLTSSQVGLVLAVSGIGAFIIQPVLAGYADQPRALSLKWIVLILCGLAFLMSVLLFAVYQKSTLLTGVFYGCCAVFLQLLMPFINSLGTEVISQGIRLNWGLARGIGSVAYAMLSYVMGILTARAGIIAVPAGIMAGYGLLIAGVWVYPFCRKREGEGKQETEKETPGRALSPVAFLRK